LLSWFIGRLFARQALAPLNEVSDSLRALSGGDYTQRRFITARGDEIAELTGAYNAAAASVAAAMGERHGTGERMRRFVAAAGSRPGCRGLARVASASARSSSAARFWPFPASPTRSDRSASTASRSCGIWSRAVGKQPSSRTRGGRPTPSCFCAPARTPGESRRSPSPSGSISVRANRASGRGWTRAPCSTSPEPPAVSGCARRRPLRPRGPAASRRRAGDRRSRARPASRVADWSGRRAAARPVRSR